jgi:hypothetical protein
MNRGEDAVSAEEKDKEKILDRMNKMNGRPAKRSS